MDQEIKQGFEKIDQKIDKLADAVKSGFDEMDKRFDENKKEHQIMHQKLEDIELRLGNVAYRFEMQELDKRIKKLEAKIGLESQGV